MYVFVYWEKIQNMSIIFLNQKSIKTIKTDDQNSRDNSEIIVPISGYNSILFNISLIRNKTFLFKFIDLIT